MKKTFKLVSAFVAVILLCGCFAHPQTPNNNPGVQTSNTNPPAQPTNTNSPAGDLTVTSEYTSDTVNIYVRGGMFDSGKAFIPKDPTYRTMPKSVCEYGDDVYFRVGNSVYKQNQNGDLEEIFESDSQIYSFLGVWEDKIVYVKENGKDGRNFNLSTFWVYDCETGTSRQITDSNFTSYYSIVYDKYLIVYDGRLLLYDIENHGVTITDDISEKTEEEWQKYLPELFVAKTISTGKYYSEVGLYAIDNDQEIQIGLSQYVVDNKYLDFGGVGNRFSEYKWTYHNDSVYTVSVYPKYEDPNSPLKGTDEICDTVNWDKDVLGIADKDNLNPVKVQDIYEDDKNRIIGYNPDTNEVYLYLFENNTITSKDLDDQSETVIETLEEAETIEFEWCDMRLYWLYVKNGTEEYGGVHEFAK